LSSSKNSNNPLLGIALTSPAISASPISSLIYGQRMLLSSAQTSLSYSFSPRLSVSFNAAGSRTEHLSQNEPMTGESSFAIPDTTSGTAGVYISYSLSPRTQLGGSVNTVRTSSLLEDSYTTTSLLSLGRTLNRRWLMQVYGGVGESNILRERIVALPTVPRPVFRGSLAYKTPSHTFLGSYDRTTTDSFGLGASTTSSAGATWLWRRTARPWWLEANFSWQQLLGSVLTNTSGLRVSVGLSRAVGNRAVFLTEYVYMNYSSHLQAPSYQISQSAIRIALTWDPQGISPR
jgi:hypothetical protein